MLLSKYSVTVIVKHSNELRWQLYTWSPSYVVVRRVSPDVDRDLTTTSSERHGPNQNNDTRQGETRRATGG